MWGMATEVPNVCAGPFGAAYDFYIERPRLMRTIGRALWGIDASPIYESIAPLERAGDGMTVADVPCGGGVAFRALRPDQDVRYLAVDLSPKMLHRARRRAAARSLAQVEAIEADMTELPFADGEVDLFLSISGLHMVPEPGRAVAEIGRCLKPGGLLSGTTFLDDGTRRCRALYKAGSYRGHPLPPAREEVIAWLHAAGLEDVEVGPQRGFVAFSGRRAPS